jgi:hypothetical protein
LDYPFKVLYEGTRHHYNSGEDKEKHCKRLEVRGLGGTPVLKKLEAKNLVGLSL